MIIKLQSLSILILGNYNVYNLNNKSTMQQEGHQGQTFISCLSWIRAGYAARVPRQIEMTEEQMLQLKNDPLMRQEMSKNMDDQEEEEELPIFSENVEKMQKSQANNKYPLAILDLSDEDIQDYYIKDTDSLIVAGKVEKQYSSLEIYIYQKEKNNLFVHHEIMLTSFPLSIQWLNVSLGTVGSDHQSKGNYAIVSSFLPEIQIWNLDLVEALQPDLVLGGEIVSKKKPKKFSNKSKKYEEGSHTDSVLTVSLNSTHKNILASGSADHLVKIWDLQKGKNIFTCQHHKGIVSKVKWNPTESTILLTSSNDGKLAILDSRYPDDKIFHEMKAKETIEGACWNINNTSQIGYCTDQGNMYMIDGRMPNKPLVKVSVHGSSSVSDIVIGNKNLCYTCSEDESVKIWNLLDMSSVVAFKKPKCGKMYSLDLMEVDDSPILGVGNGKGELFVWETCENQKVEAIWKS